ncbi:MAG: histidine phosphatase family protein [Anaerolineaceae bacterium]|nr:histidine phosphatase family protein [Anaerolineaceae bacterium]
MKEIILMRHAKSSWKDAEIKDFDRPLNKRGKKDAPKMGKILLEKDIIPDRIFSSSAKRARLTAEAVAKSISYADDVIYMEELYLAEPETILNVLKNQADEFNRIMFVGHNPGMEWFLQMMCGEVVSLPTATVAHIRIPIDHWGDLDEEVEGDLLNRWKPKKQDD